MRLRYLSLKDAPPLQDLAIPFWQEMVLGRECAIRFVVGVNWKWKKPVASSFSANVFNHTIFSIYSITFFCDPSI